MKSTFSKILLASLLTFGLHGAEAEASKASAIPKRYFPLVELVSVAVGGRKYQVVDTNIVIQMLGCITPGCKCSMKASRYALDTRGLGAIVYIDDSDTIIFRQALG